MKFLPLLACIVHCAPIPIPFFEKLSAPVMEFADNAKWNLALASVPLALTAYITTKEIKKARKKKQDAQDLKDAAETKSSDIHNQTPIKPLPADISKPLTDVKSTNQIKLVREASNLDLQVANSRPIESAPANL